MTIRINKENISKREYYGTIKNYCLLARLKHAKVAGIVYRIPYGGCAESNMYNLYEIHYNFS
jgi:hypothetical protein